MNNLRRKINRYLQLVKKFSNWPQFLLFKITARKNDSFTFKLRNSFNICVPRQLLGPFRECFLDEIYLKHVNPQLLDNEKPIIIDIGANVGYFSLFMFTKYPKATIHAFEPMPYCFKLLKQYQSEYSQFDFHIYSEAISDKEGSIDLYTDAIDGFTTKASILFTDKSHKIEVHTRTLDQFMRDAGIQKTNMLKLDCEGAEYKILYNLPEPVWQNISFLSLEVHNAGNNSENIEALSAFLKKQNYQVEYVGDKQDNVGHVWASR